MTNLGPYEVHPAADSYPMIEGEEFDKLVQSVKENGLREPIILSHDGTVLIDGRNRYRACEEATVDPIFDRLGSHYDDLMILNLIVDRNERRRDLNAGQKAGISAELEPMFAKAVKEREEQRKAASVGNTNSHHGDSASTRTPVDRPESQSKEQSKDAHSSRSSSTAASQAAAATGASETATRRMKALKRDAPDLHAAVMADRISLDAAYKQARKRKREEPKPDPAPKPSPTMLTLRTHTGEEVPYPQPKAKPTFNETTGEGISWAAWSWNPVTGCLHGCKYCYARAIINRYPDANPAGFTPLFHEQRLDAPSNTAIPERHRDDDHPVSCQAEDCKVCAYRRVFVCSMADLYGRWVPDEWINQVHASMLAAPEWEYLLLTKFPDRYVGLDMPPGAWVGTSVDEQKRVRIAERAFRQIEGAKVKWLSLEPLTEPLEFSDLSMFDWVVIGAQTATHQPEGTVEAFAPPFDWVARLYIQAKEAGCKVHLKPNLNGRPGMQLPNEYPEV